MLTGLTIVLLVISAITMICTLFLVVDKFWPKIKLYPKHRALLCALKRSKLHLVPSDDGYCDNPKRIHVNTPNAGKSHETGQTEFLQWQFSALHNEKKPYVRDFKATSTLDVKQKAQTIFKEMLNDILQAYQNTSNPPHKRADNLNDLEFYANN